MARTYGKKIVNACINKLVLEDFVVVVVAFVLNKTSLSNYCVFIEY